MTLTPRPQDVEAWERSLAAMAGEELRLRQQGRWLAGPRTLLQALGMQHRETALTAALAWVLDPDGHHRLGTAALEGFLAAVGATATGLRPARISLEEARRGTRADLVVRVPGATVLVEAKVWAREQPDQLQRLADLWSDEEPVLVFLTREGAPAPRTAGASAGHWRTLHWSTVAAILREAAAQRAVAPGVEDLLTTLEVFHA